MVILKNIFEASQVSYNVGFIDFSITKIWYKILNEVKLKIPRCSIEGWGIALLGESRPGEKRSAQLTTVCMWCHDAVNQLSCTVYHETPSLKIFNKNFVT